MADPIELLISIAKDLKLLFVVLGTIFIILSFVKISGKVELIKDEDRNKARIFGAFFLIVGCALLLYPDSVDVFGTIRYWDDTPAIGATVEIDGKMTTADIDGNYRLSNIPRSANRIAFNFNRSSCQETLDIPIYSFSVNKSKKGERRNLTISGTVYDEFNNPMNNARVLITGGTSAEGSSGTISSNTDSSGKYAISGIMCDPKYRMHISVYTNKTVKEPPIYNDLLEFSGEDTRSRYKQKDIHIPSKFTVDVIGYVKEPSRTSKQQPVSDVFAEIGNQLSLSYTDSNGEFKIEKVPRNATKYNITDMSGDLIASGSVYPILSEDTLIKGPLKRTLILK